MMKYVSADVSPLEFILPRYNGALDGSPSRTREIVGCSRSAAGRLRSGDHDRGEAAVSPRTAARRYRVPWEKWQLLFSDSYVLDSKRRIYAADVDRESVSTMTDPWGERGIRPSAAKAALNLADLRHG